MYPAKDLNQARNFYENKLYLKPKKYRLKVPGLNTIFPKEVVFFITNLAQDVSPTANSGGTISFEVEDLDKLVNQLKPDCVTFKLDIFSSPVCRIAVILDLKGNTVTLHQLSQKNITSLGLLAHSQ
ncbi:VOC family protein [Candidatus Coxiella mudrowiae]|uniref:VOC family protein n=1 Tax=Candidatus Coxiella mudrowiae TaxID=2054173 RepID=UPI001FD28F8F|nr:VOC family protein [Candidatus Coxiella mudrowiae]